MTGGIVLAVRHQSSHLIAFQRMPVSAPATAFFCNANLDDLSPSTRREVKFQASWKKNEKNSTGKSWQVLLHMEMKGLQSKKMSCLNLNEKNPTLPVQI